MSPAIDQKWRRNYVAGAIVITLIIIFGILFAARRRRDGEEIPITA